MTQGPAASLSAEGFACLASGRGRGGDCNSPGSTNGEIWGDPRVHGERENQDGAGDGSLLWQDAPIGFG